MSKWSKGKLVASEKTSNFTGTLVNWITLKGINFLRTTASDKDFTKEEVQANAERLVSCWNACLHFDNPEQDIEKIIEALKGHIVRPTPEAVDTLSDAQCRAELKRVCKRISTKQLIIDEALALYKE